jgi:hypothetical protein
VIVILQFLLRVRQLDLKSPQKFGNQFTHRRHGKVPPNTCPRSTPKSKHILIHIRGSPRIQPAIGIEFRGIVTEDGFVAVDYPGIGADDRTCGEVMAADFFAALLA